MQMAEKQELVRLLNLYQTELLQDNDENVKKRLNRQWDIKVGVKAQYEHARIIATKLSCEIGRELQT